MTHRVCWQLAEPGLRIIQVTYQLYTSLNHNILKRPVTTHSREEILILLTVSLDRLDF